MVFVPLTDAATQLSQTWECIRQSNLLEIEPPLSELFNCLNSVDLHHMVSWLTTQYQRLAAMAELDDQLANALIANGALSQTIGSAP